MKLITFLQKEDDHMGVLTDRGVVDIEADRLHYPLE